jgi:hypothetical protein
MPASTAIDLSTGMYDQESNSLELQSPEELETIGSHVELNKKKNNALA